MPPLTFEQFHHEELGPEAYCGPVVRTGNPASARTAN